MTTLATRILNEQEWDSKSLALAISGAISRNVGGVGGGGDPGEIYRQYIKALSSISAAELKIAYNSMVTDGGDTIE